MSNNQFKAVPSTTSRVALDISSNSSTINLESNNKFPTRDCGSSNSTSTTTSTEEDSNYQDGALPEEQETETENQQNDEEETYSNLDLNTVKLFVGQIPYSYSEDNLYPLFSQFGPVAEIVVIRDRFTFKSRGCAFVSFRNKQDADTCIRELNQRLKLPPLNTPLRVKYAYTEQQLDNVNDNFVNNTPNLTTSSSPNDQNTEKSQDLTIASNFLSCLNIDKYEIGVPHPENKLFIRNIPKNVTEDELSTLFESFGEILDVVVLRTTIHTSKGCGFIKFTNQESADMVINTFRREIMTPIQEYQQGAQQEGTTIGGPSNQRLVELTNKLLESSFLMKGAITPLLVRYADNDYAPQDQDQQQQQQNFNYHDSNNYSTNHNPRRRKSYPSAYQNRRGSYHQQAQQHYGYQNVYYDPSSGYPHHHGLYPPNYSNYYGYGQGQDGVSTNADTVYYYHLYNNPYGATTTPNTTTTITAPPKTTDSVNGGEVVNGSNAESGPSPVPPMYYYYPPYYYHPPPQQQQQQYSTNNTATTTNSNSNNGNGSNHATTQNYQNKYYSTSHNSNHVKNNKYKSSDRKHVTKQNSDA